MSKIEDKNTRYFIDLDLETRKLINWDYDQRDGLQQKLDGNYHRIFITKGQFKKLQLKINASEK